jgi:hypothetical protein
MYTIWGRLVREVLAAQAPGKIVITDIVRK